MSCFILNDRALAALADGMEKTLNMGYNFAGMDAPQNLRDVLEESCADKYGFFEAKLIYNELYKLNARAYTGRYPYDPADETPPDFPAVSPLVQLIEWDGAARCFKITPEHFKYMKLLECLIYQCAEDATYRDPLYLALKDFRNNLCFFLVHNNPHYTAASWGAL